MYVAVSVHTLLLGQAHRVVETVKPTRVNLEILAGSGCNQSLMIGRRRPAARCDRHIAGIAQPSPNSRRRPWDISSTGEFLASRSSEALESNQTFRRGQSYIQHITTMHPIALTWNEALSGIWGSISLVRSSRAEVLDI